MKISLTLGKTQNPQRSKINIRELRDEFSNINLTNAQISQIKSLLKSVKLNELLLIKNANLNRINTFVDSEILNRFKKDKSINKLLIKWKNSIDYAESKNIYESLILIVANNYNVSKTKAETMLNDKIKRKEY